MPLDKETKDFIMKSNMVVYKKLIEQINKDVMQPIRKMSINFSNRFDDIEKRLDAIEARLKIMSRDQTHCLTLSRY